MNANPSVFLGIDPGLAGGWALVTDPLYPQIASAGRLPVWTPHRRKVLDFRALQEELMTAFCRLPHFACNRVHAIVEDVTANAVGSKAAAFSFGRSLGVLESVLYAMDRTPIRAGNDELVVSLNYISAPKWKKALNLEKLPKQASLDQATFRFGSKCRDRYWPRKGDDGVAEAALIAHYWINEHWKKA